MDQENTNSEVRFWVDKVVEPPTESSPALVQGDTFLSDRGFGEVDGRPLRSYEGQVALIGRVSQQVRRCSIGEVHGTKMGFAWQIDDVNPLPELPFLVTSELATKCIYSGTASFRLTEKLESIISGEEFPPAQLAVRAPNWYGVITVADVSKPDVGRLDAFSSILGTHVALNDRLVVLEMDDDDTEFGTIARLGNVQ